MSKLWLVAQREYLSRVKKKSFILTTLLTPLGFALLMVAVIFIMSSGNETRRIAVLDEAGLLQVKERALPDSRNLKYIPIQGEIDKWKNEYKTQNFDAILYLPKPKSGDSLLALRNIEAQYWSEEQLGVNTKTAIEGMLSNYFEKLKIQQSGIDLNLLNSFKTQVDLLPVDLKQAEVKADAGAGARVYVATFLGGLMMGLIYIVIFIYGNMVMRSVMEEKTNRIVEVIISSVKPFDLMMGKIIGVGGVGLTQFAIWGITIPLLNLLVGLIFAPQMQAIQADVQAGTSSSADILRMTQMIQELASFNYFYILGFFVLFFLAGYILYASLFAAVGAAMGDEWGEGQSLTLLISLPVVIAFYVGVAAVENPNSALSFWASLFPLFAPVVMPARLVFDPPIWQLLLSLGLLLATCLFFVWISGRIYRVGILMYGKKVTIKEFLKWIFVKY